MTTFPALLGLVDDPELASRPGAQRVYLRLLSLLDFTEARDVKAWTLADDLHIKEATVFAAFDILVERGYLIDHGRSVNNVRRFTLAWSRATPAPQGTTQND